MNIPEIFAENVFNEKAMKSALSPEVYRSLKKAVNENEPLDFNVAQEVADAMKDWAIQKGATHYSHWFQPLSGTTAEKQTSFLSIDIKNIWLSLGDITGNSDNERIIDDIFSKFCVGK